MSFDLNRKSKASLVSIACFLIAAVASALSGNALTGLVCFGAALINAGEFPQVSDTKARLPLLCAGTACALVSLGLMVARMVR